MEGATMGSRGDYEDLKKPVVLVVDDSLEFLELARAVLAPQYEVHLAIDGDEGMYKAQLLKPDAVILDMMMPRISGEQVLEHMQGLAELHGMPVLILTARHYRPSERHMLESKSNVCRYLEKTIPMPELLAELEKTIALGRLYRDTPDLVDCVRHAQVAATPAILHSAGNALVRQKSREH